MKILHTSDWHLGRSLYGHKRYEEYEQFLEWLSHQIAAEAYDVLLIAGDVFDTSTPSNKALELYYRFLSRVSSSGHVQTIVIGGNHDSPSLLNAPKQILQFLNVHVVGCASPHLDDEVLLITDHDNEPQLIVGAVPYLRDREIRRSEAEESSDDKEKNLLRGIEEHYSQVCTRAAEINAELVKKVPLVMMGHLFTRDGKVVDGDGMRDLYVGSLAHVGSEIFPEIIDYLALGHLHTAQRVNGKNNFRFSGSPLTMSFNEIKQQKYVLSVDLSTQDCQVRKIPVPQFQRFERIRGDFDRIVNQLKGLIEPDESIWVEINYEGENIVGDLRHRLDDIISSAPIEILRIKNNRIMNKTLEEQAAGKTLDELSPDDVFSKCLDVHKITEPQRSSLEAKYRRIVQAVQEHDPLAE